MTSDEPTAGGLYRFAEPQPDCDFAPRNPAESSADLLAKGASWYGGRVVPIVDGSVMSETYGVRANYDGFGEQIRRVHDLRAVSTERFAELREAALRAGQETADRAAQIEAEGTPS